jgi:rRNA maturation protein Nop10
MTFALYRCPVCDHYLSKFRPNKEKCAHCGAKVR